ncbi:hypothetical protein G7K_0044-t1 [Saitoella complicata NRRL Y-17804]|uniref:guanosine-diphosphatase n=2 Tax=Saitoella complicata (strain BCRC 22490 / CBS 7301 / JCM 7358 / NBRC 10748 / NRRL Y-17804) TaxID=698492 RepID=A0A0E9N7K8_SAICN|nr:hypothetical protein G7K_0044-t1 [Saitoella complicata NRRL Y-17804]
MLPTSSNQSPKDLRKRPTIFSYFSFNRTQPPHDPYEKRDRHTFRPRTRSENGKDMNQGLMARYGKIAIVLVLAVMGLWMLMPVSQSYEGGVTEYEQSPVGGETDYGMPEVTVEAPKKVEEVVPVPVVAPATPEKPAAPISATEPPKPITDSKPAAPKIASSGSKATSDKCTVSHDGKKPIIQYALMIDAGSTGSRIHVYRFNNCGPTPVLEHEDFKMINPGLSAFGKGASVDAEGAARSLDPLLEVAMESVPEELRGCTPVAVKATAGLRLLGEEKSGVILDAVRKHLETKYPFPILAKDGIVIMDGSDEGVYAWITTNYLLGKIGSKEESPTAAIFDLGGGSTQIVFEPTFSSVDGGMPEKLQEGDHKYELTFGGRKFELYQHSHLGYGLMEARDAIHRLVVKAFKEKHAQEENWASLPIINPCLAPKTSKEINLDIDRSGTVTTLKMIGPDEDSASQCRYLAEQILNKSADCTLAPCSFNGIHQPSLAKTFANEDVFIFSYFYDRTAPLGMPSSFTLSELRALTKKVCGGTAHYSSFESIPGALEELADRPEWCLDLSFVEALLEIGYEMPLEREVRIAKKIGGNELGWCLGASLPMLEGGWECKKIQ